MTMSEEIARILDSHREEDDLTMDEIVVDFEEETVYHVVSTVPPPPEERPEEPTEEELEKMWEVKTHPARYRTVLPGKVLAIDNTPHEAQTVERMKAAVPIEPDSN